MPFLFLLCLSAPLIHSAPTNWPYYQPHTSRSPSNPPEIHDFTPEMTVQNQIYNEKFLKSPYFLPNGPPSARSQAVMNC